MALLPILCFPDPRLNTVAKPVQAVDARIKKLIADMLDTMYDASGIGLAATQVDVHERLVVIDDLTIDAPKTKLLSQKLNGLGFDSVLIITDVLNENLELASRNLPNVLVVEPRHADPMSLVFYKKILVTKAALAKIEEMLA